MNKISSISTFMIMAVILTTCSTSSPVQPILQKFTETVVLAKTELPAISPTIAFTNTPRPTQENPNRSYPCIQQFDLQVCVKDVQIESDHILVSLEGNSLKPSMRPGDFLVLADYNPWIKSQQITLANDLGNVVVSPPEAFGGGHMEQQGLLQTLSFPAFPPQYQKLTLEIPALLGTVSLEKPVQFQVDLGDDPQPGQTPIVNHQDLAILGQSIHFGKAVLEGDGVNSLHLTLTSDMTNTTNNFYITNLQYGNIEGGDIPFGSKGLLSPKSDLQLFADLVENKGKKKTGLLTFQVSGAGILIPGPFTFSFATPISKNYPIVITPPVTPQISSPESAILTDYQYSGRQVQNGDLLYTVVGKMDTKLFAANSYKGFSPELVAVLPGQVYQIFGRNKSSPLLVCFQTTFIGIKTY